MEGSLERSSEIDSQAFRVQGQLVRLSMVVSLRERKGKISGILERVYQQFPWLYAYMHTIDRTVAIISVFFDPN